VGPAEAYGNIASPVMIQWTLSSGSIQRGAWPKDPSPNFIGNDEDQLNLEVESFPFD